MADVAEGELPEFKLSKCRPTGTSPPPAFARPSLSPPPLWRGAAKGRLKRDTAREPMLPLLSEPFSQAHPRVRGKRLLTIQVGVP
jgi:hypothetical protein